MTQYTLTLLDTTGIQDYIFASNRLQENIGASEIVYRATTLWAFKALEEAVGTAHNIKNGGGLNWNFDKSKQIENDESLKAEVVQAAGGNTVILFREKAASREFVKKLTLYLLKEAPGLTLLAQHDDKFEFGKETANLPAALEKLSEEMGEHKLLRLGSSPLRGLGVTAICDSTGLPAVASLGEKWDGQPLGLPGEDDSSLVSTETAKKRRWRKAANNRLEHLLKDAAGVYTFPYDLEKIGRNKGEESYVAVIHADGNRMGKRVRDIGEKAKKDRDFITDLRAFSEKIEKISRTALEVVVGLVVQAAEKGDIPTFEGDDEDGEKITRKFLPFRPLVFGGDDVTFVCNGLVGVSLAVAYIEAFEKAAREVKVEDFHACAGVSIVKMHYPFARAYKLAEELTASAKKLVKDTKPERDFSALDWHFAQSGISGSLDVIREREYTVKDGKLHLRPLDMQTWEQLSAVMQEFKEKYWNEKHNKVIGLREPLRKGAKAVEIYRQDFDLKELPKKFEGLNVHLNGWEEHKCYYFDAIELLDHYVSLEAIS
jgi:hypothetical protein